VQKCLPHFVGRVDTLYVYDQGDGGIPSDNLHNLRCEPSNSLGLDPTHRNPRTLELNRKVIGVEREPSVQADSEACWLARVLDSFDFTVRENLGYGLGRVGIYIERNNHRQIRRFWILDVGENVSNPRRIAELEINLSESPRFNHHIIVVSMTVWQDRSGVDKIEYFEVRAVGQRNQEYFNRCTLERKARHGIQRQLAQVSKERYSPTDRKITEAKGGEAWCWISGRP